MVALPIRPLLSSVGVLGLNVFDENPPSQLLEIFLFFYFFIFFFSVEGILRISDKCGCKDLKRMGLKSADKETTLSRSG